MPTWSNPAGCSIKPCLYLYFHHIVFLASKESSKCQVNLTLLAAAFKLFTYTLWNNVFEFLFMFFVFLKGIQVKFQVPSRPYPLGCGIQDNVHTYNVIMYLYSCLCVLYFWHPRNPRRVQGAK